MIGDEYFQLRAQLGTALYSLSTLAQELQAEPETIEMLESLNKSLREPFLFVVVGEVKAGKSSLLNALFGREFCRSDVLPATDKITIFKYDTEERDEHVNDHVVECYRPSNFLRDFNVVDTPGTNTIAAEHQHITEGFVPVADLVLFVFSITNPWAASAWEFLNFIQQKWLKAVVFVVQQTDLRSPEEVASVVQHLEQTAREKLGDAPPIFAVSAKEALLAKTADEESARQPAESRFGELEAYINNAVTHGEARLGKLRSVCTSGQIALQDLSAKARNAFDIVRKDAERLAGLHTVLDDRKEQSLRQVGGVLWSLTQSYERMQKRGEELLQEKLSWAETLKLVFHKKEWQASFQQTIDEQLHDSLKRQIANSIELLETDVKSVWQQLHESIQKSFALEMPPPPSPPGFSSERDELLKRIEGTLTERMSNEQIEAQMTRLFSETSAWLRLPAGVAAAGGVAAIVGAVLAQSLILNVAAVMAGVATLFGTAIAVAKRNQITAEFRSQMARKREEVLAPIEDHLRQAIALFYEELAATFQPLQGFVSAQEQIYEPVLARLEQLDEAFSNCAAQLGLGTSQQG